MVVVSVVVVISLDGQGILVDGYQRTIVCAQTHVSVTYGLLNAAVQNVVERLRVLGPLYTVNIEGVVDHLSSVLTRQARLQSGVNAVQNASSASVLQDVSLPCRTGQTSLLSIVTGNYEQHLSCFYAGNGCIRVKLVVALACDDALGFAELDVACSPVLVDVGQLSRVVLVSRIVNLIVADNKDHLCHLRTSNSCVRLVRAIVVTVDDTQCRKHVHSVSCLDVGLIRERRTGKHSERASERQYQCENLFEIAGKSQFLRITL